MAKGKKAKAAPKEPKSTAKRSRSPVIAPKAEHNGGSDSVADALLDALKETERIVQSERFYHPTEGAAIPDFSDAQVQHMLNTFDTMICEFADPRYKSLYGYSQREDEHLFSIPVGSGVPMYYANVGTSNIYQRKLLSLLGLRNLVLHGRPIFRALRAARFSALAQDYAGSDLPPMERMRRYTGNVVDLDTTVLRCSDRTLLQTINASRQAKQLKPFRCGDDLSYSKEGRQMAIHAAQGMIEVFEKEVGPMTLAERLDRRIVLSETSASQELPTAGSNQERGLWPLWRYANVGVNSFHANVPCLTDVTGSLLKAPMLICVVFAQLTARGERLDAFFEDCVVDSCFNMKWKAIEAFHAAMKASGSIHDVLNQLQQENQAMFPADLLDNDPGFKKEAKIMMGLAKGKTARDADGDVRPITRKDVDDWIRAVNAC